MTPNASPASSRAWLAIAVLAASTLLMWLPALHTPFWGDDYVFLQAAHATNASGSAWWSDFWPTSPLRFWRPLSQEGYWRLIDAWLDGDAVRAHAVNLVLHVLASAAVALLGVTVARACRWAQPGAIGALSGVLHGALGMHLLPVHWVAAANNALLTLFTALLLAAWIAAREARVGARRALLASLPVLLALALLSKESAALTPLLMGVLWVFAGFGRPARGEVIGWLACAATVLAWLVLRERFTANTDAAYALTLDRNVLRNAASFVAWMLNVPREALRMALTGDVTRGAMWITATALPMALAWAIGGHAGRASLTRWQWSAVAVFCLCAYAPYFLFAWNSYEYYAAIAAILPVIALARCVTGHRRAWFVVVLVAVSSWVAVAGTRLLDHPGLIGRARWGEAVLQQLAAHDVPVPLHVRVDDAQRFYAIGPAGLAWRLGLQRDEVRIVETCPAATRCLRLHADGRWAWETAP